MDNEQITKLNFEIGAASNKQKLGEYLFENLHGLSKMYLRELIRDGKCEVNGTHVNSGYLLRPNDFVEVEADLSRGTAMRPQNIPLDIIYEDADIVVVIKPAEMLVHPTHRDRDGTLLNALTYYLNRGREASVDGDGIPLAAFIRPGLPHRLDKQTSGLMVIAVTPRAHRRLSAAFMKKQVKKAYLALVEGVVVPDEGSMHAPIGRFADLKYWGVKEDGKLSESRFHVRERFPDTTLLELEPVTGRTNQLRIHCQSIGHPIVGDVERGGREFGRLCLHAYKLAFAHPVNREVMEFQSEVRAGFAG